MPFPTPTTGDLVVPHQHSVLELSLKEIRTARSERMYPNSLTGGADLNFPSFWTCYTKYM